MEPFVWDQAQRSGASLLMLDSWTGRYAGLTAGFTTRLGGVSGKPWASLNMGLHVGDKNEAVVENRRLLTEAIGWPFESFTCAEQVHSDHVQVVKAEDAGRGRDSRQTAFQHTDALVTNVPGVLLASFYADCVPLYFYDPENNAVGLAHAGWKGTAAEIAIRTVETMREHYGTDPAKLYGAIGPAIGVCCYEVDGAVIGRMEELCRSFSYNTATFDSSAAAIERMVQHKGGGKAMLDLKEINRHIMIKAGILPIHIELTNWCTSCSNDLLYSHRAEHGATGRMASWIGIEKR
ncbi:peptidoglycan editing factor PgeF [Paenibacillus xylaniclasticus]|uniref:peptidoglycan editing factor PgeF n=1 Tax=Paenibacillus xylaniclasticus TaxID=588083 RepID=UPI000FD959BD|nr:MULTISPECIES: peptidoglycan editing factor PgeF [Paenibacillus]GFN30411.1 laccase domain protein [Paenibacillus curdlanolyticus]